MNYQLEIPTTNFPRCFIIPKDKVSNKLFNGKLAVGSNYNVATENKKSKKELTAKVSIDFDELKDIEISRSLTKYDRV